jgi:hypothetical protein
MINHHVLKESKKKNIFNLENMILSSIKTMVSNINKM